MARIEEAKEGTEFVLRGEVLTVGPKCNDDAGQWVCITHAEVLQHNLAKASHTYEGEHTLAWQCYSHGPEVP